MIRDAVALERKGVPVAVLVHDKFVPEGRAMARVLKLPSLRIISVPQPMPWETADDERKKAEAILGTIVGALTEAQPTAEQA